VNEYGAVGTDLSCVIESFGDLQASYVITRDKAVSGDLIWHCLYVMLRIVRSANIGYFQLEMGFAIVR
jgi:hypothetical protein